MRACLLALVVACRLPYGGGARDVTPAELDASWLRATSTPAIIQARETDCGSAALAMIAGAWGHRWSVAELDAALRPSRDGVRLGALRDVARARGLDAYAIAGTRADLAHELGRGRPVVLGLVLPYDGGHERSHYEVAVAMDPRDGTIVTIDPASGKLRRRSADVLELEWKTAHHAALVVVADRNRQW